MRGVDDLVRFRESLVEMRRTCAAKADGVLTRGDRAELAGQMKTIQEWIECIDRAIEDEKKLNAREPRRRDADQPLYSR
jgi:hypothetical protein